MKHQCEYGCPVCKKQKLKKALDVCSKIHIGEIGLENHGKANHYQLFLDATTSYAGLPEYSALLEEHIHSEHNWESEIKWPDLDNCATCQSMTLEFFNIAYQYYIWDLTGVFD